MHTIVKSALLGFGLAVGAGLAAQAQSVSSLPPAGAQPATAPPVAVSAPTIGGPNPGSNVSIANTSAYHKPPDYDSNRNYHPYSSSGGGPNPGSNVPANSEPYTPSATAESLAGHPYSPGGAGPNPGR